MARPRVRVRTAGVLLGLILAALLATDLVGAALDVTAGRTAWSTAFSPAAALCAPWPMIVAQVLASTVTLRWAGRWPGRLAAVLLALACGISVLSGFFDEQLARADLAPGEVGFQLWLLALTSVLGVVALLAGFGRTPAGRRPEATGGTQVAALS